MKNLPSANEVADSKAEAKIVSVGNLSLDRAIKENHASNSAIENANSLKVPACRTWSRSKGILYEKSDTYRKSRDEGDSPDVWSDPDTSSIMHLSLIHI